jgi:predicted amidohydrolase YtcJ
MRGVVGLGVGVLSMMVLGCSSDRRADLVVLGTLRTMEPSAPVAEAMAIAGGKIVFIGDAQRAQALLDRQGRTIRLAPEQMAMPGIVDSHVHMLEAGLLQLHRAIAEPKTKEVLYAAIAECAADDPDSQWLLGSGWPSQLFDQRGPRKEDLDALVPDRPAVFYGEDGHSAWLHMHAIGDRAIRQGLDALAAARAANGASLLRHHMAHLELADAADVPRLAQLGVFGNFQPFWMFRDESIEEVEPLIGAERTTRLYSIRSFEQAGTRIVAGSDWPVSTPNPFPAIEVGMTRRDPTNPSAPVWNPDQRVSLDTLLAAYTIEGARVNHREDSIGSLAVGKAADFIILDRNLFEVPPDQIGETRVLATFVDGQQVYEAL